MAVHPLRPATHHCLGGPLPHQPANGTQSSLLAHLAFMIPPCEKTIISGISIRFQMLSRSKRQVLYALLTRAPPKSEDSSRLACVKHSVSVHPEPGSNSSFDVSQFHCFDFLHLVCVVCLLSFSIPFSRFISLSRT